MRAHPNMAANTAWDRYLDEHEAEHLAALEELPRIPSVSALPAHAPDINRAAEWVAGRPRGIGVPEVELLPTAGAGPAVFGRWHVGDDRSTALIYAHYDVRPGDPFELWESAPFDPVVRDGAIYARGATDDKGGLLGAVNGIEAYTPTVGEPPINLIFLFEGEEEIGSPTLPRLVASERERLACDVVSSADGGMYSSDMGFYAWNMPDCRAHAPNEFMRLEHYRAQADGYALLLSKPAEPAGNHSNGIGGV